MKLGRNWWAIGTVAFLAAYCGISVLSHPGYRLTVLGDLTDFVLLALAALAMFSNALITRGQVRIFWVLMGCGFTLWLLNQFGWTWVEVVQRKPLPDPFFGDTVLFLHVVPMMAAVALRPHRPHGERKLYFSTLNFLMLLVWWTFLYLFIVFPDEYISLNTPVYSKNYDILYLVQNLTLVAGFALSYLHSAGPWRKVYLRLLAGCTFYAIAADVANHAINKQVYYTGSLYDVPLLASICLFIAGALQARELRPESEPPRESSAKWMTLVPRLAMLAILSLPVMGYWALFMNSASLQLRQFRLMVALAAVLVLGLFLFLKQYRLDRDLVRLLQESRHSLTNLQRVQSELVQKEKLASLGNLVAGAAREINDPLADILACSGKLCDNPALTPVQLSMSKKIGQQAQRTRDLVEDLLRFSQQAPAQKTAIDWGALLHRAVQADGLHAASRKAHIEVQVQPNLPRIWGNANQLLQAALQVIGNAIDALEEVGGGTLVISLRQENDNLVAEFSDTGNGIRDPQRVFDPFYTTKPIGKGTGLGLSATYGIVQDHLGQIACHNKPEGGAVFVMTLPISAAETPAPEAAQVGAAV